MTIRAVQNSSRHISTTSLSVGSAAGASTAVFGSQTYQIRIASDTSLRYIVGDSPSVSSTVIANTGALLPANTVEHVMVTPGQRISFVNPASSVSATTVTETGA